MTNGRHGIGTAVAMGLIAMVACGAAPTQTPDLTPVKFLATPTHAPNELTR